MISKDTKISVYQAYQGMIEFLNRHYFEFGQSELGGVLGDIHLLKEGQPADPAAWEDWVLAIQEVMAEGGVRADDLVRVVRLTRAEREIHGSPEVVRQPVIGDVGKVVYHHLPNNTDEKDWLMVQCTGPTGLTFWTADFMRDEVEKISEKSS